MILLKKGDIKLSTVQTLFFCFIIFSLIFVRDVFSISIHKMIFVLIIPFFMLISKKDDYIKILFFIIPLISGLPGNYIIPISLIIYLFKSKSLNKNQIFFSIFVLINETVSYLLYNSIVSDFGTIMAGLSYIPLFFILLYDNNGSKKEFIKYFLLGVASLCIVLLITNVFSVDGNIFKLFTSGQYRIGDKFIDDETGGLTLKINSNTLAYFCITSICFCISMFKKVASKNQFILVFLIFLFSITGFFTLSRTFFICYFISIILYFIFSVRNVKTMIKSLLILFSISWLLILFFSNNSFVMQGIVSRFELENISTMGGRTEIFDNYVNKFASSPKFMLLGTGSTNIRNKYNISNSIHNGFFQVVICYGLPGSLLFFYGIFSCFNKGKKRYTIRKADLVPLIIVILFIQTIQFINPYVILFPYVISKYILVDCF